MATVTQTLNGQISGISIAPDGKIYATLEWVDSSVPASIPNPVNPKAPPIPQRPKVVSRVMIRIEGDKLYINNDSTSVAELQAGTSASAASLVAAVKSSVDASITSGKLKP